MTVQNYVVNTLVSWRHVSAWLGACFIVLSAWLFYRGVIKFFVTVRKESPYRDEAPILSLFSAFIGFSVGFWFLNSAYAFGWENLAALPLSSRSPLSAIIGFGGAKTSDVITLMSTELGSIVAPLSEKFAQVKIGLSVFYFGFWTTFFVGYVIFVQLSTTLFFAGIDFILLIVRNVKKYVAPSIKTWKTRIMNMVGNRN